MAGDLIRYHVISRSLPSEAERMESFWRIVTDRAIDVALTPLMWPAISAASQPLYLDVNSKKCYVDNLRDLYKEGDRLWINWRAWAGWERSTSAFIFKSNQYKIWKRLQLIPETSPDLAHGALFEWAGYGVQAPNKSDEFELAASSEAPSREDLIEVGFFNPLILNLPLKHELKLGKIAQSWCERFIDADHLLDIVPSFSEKAHPRVRLHSYFAQHGNSNTDSPIQWLLLSKAWVPSETPFLMLDALGGTFQIKQGLGGIGSDYFWIKPHPLVWQDDLLAKWCLEKLGVKEHSGNVCSIISKPKFAKQKHYFQMNDPSMVELRKLLLEVTQGENCSEFAKLKDDAVDIEEAIEALVEENLLSSNSTIMALLPSAPEFLPSAEQRDWENFVGTCAVDLISSPLYGEVSWIKFLLHRHGARNISHHWCTDDDSWWYWWYWRLFQGGKAMSWTQNTSGVLGEAALGKLMLGSSGGSSRKITEFQLA